MELIEYLQSLATNGLTMVATIFEFLGQLPFFIIMFALFYLVFDKKFAFKYWLTYFLGFAIGSLALKNIIANPRPYQKNASLRAIQNAYSGSLPSATAILAGQNSIYFYASVRKNTGNKICRFLTFIAVIVMACLIGLSKIYFAHNYLLDIIVGLAIGFVLSLIVLNFVKLEKAKFKHFMWVLAPLLIVLLLCFSGEMFTNNFANNVIFEFVGLSLAILIGCSIEEKYIKYEVKNNLIFTAFKIFITLIILCAYYYLCQVLPGIVVFSFLKYFVSGFIVTVLLPLLFKKSQKYFYIFSSKVSEEKVENSFISISEKKTKSFAKKIFESLKPGEVVLLSGDLGAGKSVLVRNILNHAGIEKSITSPTFTLVNEYNTNSHHFYHFDMYRIEDDEEVVNIGFDEIIDDNNAIKFIEWPEKVESHLPSKYKKITIVKLGKNSRNIIVENY